MQNSLLALFIGRDLRLIAVEVLGKGGVGHCRAQFGALMDMAAVYRAHGFFLVHNQPPSSDSHADATVIACTQELKSLSSDLDIPLIEHFVIVGDEMRVISA